MAHWLVNSAGFPLATVTETNRLKFKNFSVRVACQMGSVEGIVRPKRKFTTWITRPMQIGLDLREGHLNNPEFSRRVSSATVFIMAAVLAVVSPTARAMAQNPQLQQRFAEIKQAAAANRQSLARYTWQERQTIVIKGAVKKQELFQVHLGPDGKPLRTLVSSNPPSSSAGGPLRQKIVDRKTVEYEQYGQQIAALAQSYAQPDPQRLQQSYQRGDVTLGSAGPPGEVKLMIGGYIKPNDSVEVVFNEAQKALQSLQISTYLNDPKDVVRISAQFSKLPDGTTHLSSMTVDNVTKQLSVRVQNASYQKL